MREYRYQLERYRGRESRHRCPQCRRRGVFTRYIDTYNNMYINDNVGKCNRIDKCGYHYTPKQYFTDNGYRVREWENGKIIGKFPFSHCQTPPTIGYIAESVAAESHHRALLSDHVVWLIVRFGEERAREVVERYGVGGDILGRTIFWQRDIEGRLRTGKIMSFDTTTGRRHHRAGSIDWVHSLLRRQGVLDDEWHLVQCLYGEHLLTHHPTRVVALVEAYKTAHVGSILYPEYLWLATDSLSGLNAERLKPLKGREVLLLPDEGRGFECWSRKVAEIAPSIGFDYRISSFVELNGGCGDDIVDLVVESRAMEPTQSSRSV